MKRLAILTALLVPMFAIAAEEVVFDGITEPLWKDFAPSAFVNIEEPKGLGKLNETATYWYKRKLDFDSSIEECRLMEDADMKFSCFQEVKVKQYQKNSDYNARIEAQERTRMGPREMYDRTDTMLPIGGYLNNFTRFQPNEFQ